MSSVAPVHQLSQVDLAQPKALSVKSQNIPETLRKRERWVVWKFEYRKGKWTKVPHQTNGALASTIDPGTWTSFKRALHAYRTGGWDGMGFVVTEDDGIVGVDLDHCRDPKTGTIERWAQQIIAQLNSYTELSPSGCGVHIFVRARLRSAVNRKGNVEIYSKSRYLTMTGRVMR